MLLGDPSSVQAITPAIRRNEPTVSGDALFTEDYGDDPENKRTLGGGVDFFSSLGTEHKRKDKKPDRPDPEKVC